MCSLLDGIKPALDRLEAARKTLQSQLEGVLTPEQKASGCVPLGYRIYSTTISPSIACPRFNRKTSGRAMTNSSETSRNTRL